MMDNGLMICSTAMGKSRGLMDLLMREPTSLAKSMVTARIAGTMALLSLVTGTKTKSQDQGLIRIQTEGNSKANGWITTCMDLENIRGRMADPIKVSM